MHLSLEQQLILFSTLQPGSSLQIVSTFQQYSLLVSDCSQTPFTLKMKRKFPGEQAYYFLSARLYHRSHYLCATFPRMLRGTMDILPFCLSSSAPPTHKGKAPESCLRVEDALITQEEHEVGNRQGGRDAKRFYPSGATMQVKLE